MSKQKSRTVNVQNKINMNLNQNDLIEVAIQTQLELLEFEIQKLEQERKNHQTELKEIKNKYINDAIEESKNNSSVKKFIDGCKKLNPEAEILFTNTYIKNYIDKIESKEFLDYQSCYNAKHKNNPLNYFKTNLVKNRLSDSIGNEIQFLMSCDLGDTVLNLKTPITFKVSDKLYKNYKKALTVHLEKMANTIEEYNIAKMNYFELKYNEKKYKAKFIKTAMNKSEEGRAFLKLLEEATKFKLLN